MYGSADAVLEKRDEVRSELETLCTAMHNHAQKCLSAELVEEYFESFSHSELRVLFKEDEKAGGMRGAWCFADHNL